MCYIYQSQLKDWDDNEDDRKTEKSPMGNVLAPG